MGTCHSVAFYVVGNVGAVGFEFKNSNQQLPAVSHLHSSHLISSSGTTVSCSLVISSLHTWAIFPCSWFYLLAWFGHVDCLPAAQLCFELLPDKKKFCYQYLCHWSWLTHVWVQKLHDNDAISVSELKKKNTQKKPHDKICFLFVPLLNTVCKFDQPKPIPVCTVNTGMCAHA